MLALPAPTIRPVLEGAFLSVGAELAEAHVIAHSENWGRTDHHASIGFSLRVNSRLRFLTVIELYVPTTRLVAVLVALVICFGGFTLSDRA